MKQTIPLKLDGVGYQLKFGYGFLRKLGEFYKLKSYQDVSALIETKLGDLSNISFDQEDLLKNFFYFAALNAEDKNAKKLLNAEIIDFITSESKALVNVFEAFKLSFPGAEGKQKPRKPARTK